MARISDPFVNGKGATRISVNATAAELAQVAQVFGARSFAATFDATEFATLIAPALAKAAPAWARQAHEAGVTRDPARESARTVKRAPKIDTPPAATPFDANALASVVAQAVDAALAARDKAAKSSASLAKARAAKAAKRDAQIAEQIAKTK